jgi:D-aspartate ligase
MRPSSTRKGPLAVILGSTVAGLSITRSLGRRGVPTLQIDSDRNEAMHSRYGESYLLPPRKEHEKEWIDFLKSIGKSLEKPAIIIPTADEYLLFLSRNRRELEQSFCSLLPDSDIVECIVNKRTQYAAAELAGISIPKTLYPETISDVRSWARDLTFPVILKPYTFKGRRVIHSKVLLLESPAQLVQDYSCLGENEPEFMIQEVIPGGSSASFAYHGFWGSDGNELACWMKAHVRGTPFGCSSVSVLVNIPELERLTRRLLSSLGYRGFVNVQFMLDSRDNSYRLMEINARPGQAIQHGVTAGVDLPWIGYGHLAGKGSFSSARQAVVTYMDEKVDLELWRSGGVSLGTLLQSVVQADSNAYWAWNDPGPFLALTWNFGCASFRRAVHKHFPHPRRVVSEDARRTVPAKAGTLTP